MLTTNFESGQQSFYAADAGIERSLHDLIRESSWSAVLAGGVTSTFVDSPPHVLPDGTSVDITAMTNALQSDTDEFYGPETLNRPVWTPYAYGPLDLLLPSNYVGTNSWVAVWVGDDPGETDANPAVDSNFTILLRAEAYGQGGSRRVIEASASRQAESQSDGGYLGQRGQGAENQRSREQTVQTPGAVLTEMVMSIDSGGLSQ
jgi:hypothetical protein